jgi:hypothetical protein
MRILRISALILSVLILSAGAAKADGTDAASDGKNKGEFISDSKDGDRAMDRDSFGADRDGKKFEEGADFSTSLTGKGTTQHTFGFGSTEDVRATTPEPATLLLLGSGLLGFAAFRRRRASSN